MRQLKLEASFPAERELGFVRNVHSGDFVALAANREEVQNHKLNSDKVKAFFVSKFGA